MLKFQERETISGFQLKNNIYDALDIYIALLKRKQMQLKTVKLKYSELAEGFHHRNI